MKIKKFIERVKESLGLEDFEKAGKRKSLKRVLKKLDARKESIRTALKESSSKKANKELEEELEIISLQIKKGKKLLDKLNDK